jgi:sporulation protein YlmC with PRC-barrel domain
MRNHTLPAFLLTAALLGVGATVTAQTPSDPNGSSTAQPLSSQHGAFSNAAHASDIIDKKAYGEDGEAIGTVNDLIITSSGRVDAAVVEVGGFLGIGQHTVAVDWSEIKINPSADRVTIAMTKDQLKAAPEYKKTAQSNVPTTEQTGQVPTRNGTTTDTTR